MRLVPHVLQHGVILGVEFPGLEQRVELPVIAALVSRVGPRPQHRLARLRSNRRVRVGVARRTGRRIRMRRRAVFVQKVLQGFDFAPLLQIIANAVDLIGREFDRRVRGHNRMMQMMQMVTFGRGRGRRLGVGRMRRRQIVVRLAAGIIPVDEIRRTFRVRISAARRRRKRGRIPAVRRRRIALAVVQVQRGQRGARRRGHDHRQRVMMTGAAAVGVVGRCGPGHQYRMLEMLRLLRMMLMMMMLVLLVIVVAFGDRTQLHVKLLTRRIRGRR